MNEQEKKIFSDCQVIAKRNSDMNYMRFSERKLIEKLFHEEGRTIRYIANQLGRDFSSVKNEMDRNGGKENYNCIIGQKRAFKNGCYSDEDSIAINYDKRIKKTLSLFDIPSKPIIPEKNTERLPSTHSPTTSQNEINPSETSISCPFDLLKTTFNEMQKKIQVLEMQINILTKRIKND